MKKNSEERVKWSVCFEIIFILDENVSAACFFEMFVFLFGFNKGKICVFFYC